MTSYCSENLNGLIIETDWVLAGLKKEVNGFLSL